MTTVKLTATFPAVREFQDYHDLYHYADDLNKLFSSSKVIRYNEVGFCDGGCYWGVFYIGRKPSKSVIKELLDAAGYVPQPEW